MSVAAESVHDLTWDEMSDSKFTLQPERWYAWQMLPGYAGERNVPYFSPILLREVVPRKTGRGILKLRFRNALYADGVQEFAQEMRVLKHAADFLVAEILVDRDIPSDRVGIVSHIEFEWLRRFCPGLWEAHPPGSFGPVEQGSVSHYLRALFPQR